MIRDITIGQFYRADSVLHRLDPRTKIIGMIFFIISLFIGDIYYNYVIAFLFLAFLIVLSKVPVGFMTRGLKAIMLIIVLTVLINLFFIKDGTVVFEYRFIRITTEGIRLAFFMGFRLIALIMGSSLLTLTTTPLKITDGVERLLKPLSKIGVPSHEIAMMMTISLRFIPILLEETDKIIKAQKARGADFETGGFIKRTKSMVPILVPLFVSAFRRADDLALAMESRCYRGGEGRTRMKELRYSKGDYIAFAVLILYLAVLITLKVVTYV